MDNEEKEYLRKRKENLMKRRQKLPTSPSYRCPCGGDCEHIQLLLDSGLCSEEQIECARESAQPYKSTAATLIRTGKIDQLEFARICAAKAKVRFIDIPDHEYVNDSYGQRSAAFEWSQGLRGRVTYHFMPMVPLPFYGHPRLIVVSDPLAIFELQEMVEEKILKPMCARMGFIEEDEWGIEQVVYPTLSFTRLALRDNNDTFDALFNLYQKGSLDVDIILELLNIDPVATKEKLERDLFTLNDSSFNEVLRGIYGDVGRALAENSDAAEKIAENLGLKYEVPEEDGGGGRF